MPDKQPKPVDLSGAENYAAKADASRSAAEGEILENVRQKHLTSAATWDNLAQGTLKMEALRSRRLATRQAAAAAMESDLSAHAEIRHGL